MKINGILFHVSEEVIVMVMGLAMKGRKWEKVTWVTDETSLQCFLVEVDKPIWHRGDFMSEKLPDSWNKV